MLFDSGDLSTFFFSVTSQCSPSSLKNSGLETNRKSEKDFQGRKQQHKHLGKSAPFPQCEQQELKKTPHITDGALSLM